MDFFSSFEIIASNLSLNNDLALFKFFNFDKFIDRINELKIA
jgi:hypothetical protein